METGDIIKALRLERNLTQEQLGDILGVQKSAIAKYEKGRVENLKRNTIQKMARYFNVSPLLFLGYEDLNNDGLMFELSEKEIKLITKYRSLPDDKKELAIKLIDTLT